jgi:hypothetical protein
MILSFLIFVITHFFFELKGMVLIINSRGWGYGLVLGYGGSVVAVGQFSKSIYLPEAFSKILFI